MSELTQSKAELEAKIAEQRTIMQRALAALEESRDLVEAEYQNYWGRGIPTRKDTEDALRQNLAEHEAVIDLLKKALA